MHNVWWDLFKVLAYNSNFQWRGNEDGDEVFLFLLVIKAWGERCTNITRTRNDQCKLMTRTIFGTQANLRTSEAKDWKDFLFP